MDRSGFMTFDKKKKQFVTVNSLMDLNQDASLSKPVTASNDKTFGCFCCTSGPLSAMVNLPRSGYTGGESIPISAEIENLSDKVMSKSQAKLIQSIVFKGKNEEGKHTTKSVERTLQVKEYN